MHSGWDRVRLRVETGENSTLKMANNNRTLSTHVLDTSLGKAAVGVAITAYRLSGEQQWHELKQVATDEDGRASGLLDENEYKNGIYKLQFDVGKYYDRLGVECFYPFIEIVVKCVTSQHYHMPLLLSPFGYTTYRGT